MSTVLNCSDVNICSVGKHPLVVRFLKGVAQSRPSLPRYKYTWDVNIMLKFFRRQPLVKFITLKDLTWKLVMLTALISAQRCQSLHMMRLDQMCKTEKACVFTITGNFKQARPGFAQFDIVIPKFEDDVRICVYSVLVEYIRRTENLRTGPELFISFVTPHKPVTKDTLGRWIKQVMTRAGIDTSIFLPHSSRSASTSCAKKAGVPLSEILKTAAWSNVGTFVKFYDKPVMPVKEIDAKAYGQILFHS